MIFNKSMKRLFYAKIHIFFVKKLFARIQREKKLFEAAEWLQKIVCWLTKMGALPVEKYWSAPYFCTFPQLYSLLYNISITLFKFRHSQFKVEDNQLETAT